jgi:hypothetical protein
MSSLGFGTQASTPTQSMPPSRTGNGLLNALSANSRAAEVRSPTAGKYISQIMFPLLFLSFDIDMSYRYTTSGL